MTARLAPEHESSGGARRCEGGTRGEGRNTNDGPTPASLAAWAVQCPGNNESAGKRKSGRTRKGNAIIRFILCECANAARMTKSTLRPSTKA